MSQILICTFAVLFFISFLVGQIVFPSEKFTYLQWSQYSQRVNKKSVPFIRCSFENGKIELELPTGTLRLP